MTGILLIILQALYFILPAGVANMFPVVFRKISMPLGFPISEVLFGKNKTWKGLYLGIIGAGLTLCMQRYFMQAGIFDSLVLMDYKSIHLGLFTVLFGLGALLGDLIESYIKRRKNMPPGDAWFPWDQLDWVIASILFVSPLYWIGWSHLLVLLIITPLLHTAINGLGYLLGLKDVRW